MLKSDETELLHALNSHEEAKINQAFEHIYDRYVKLVYFVIAKYIDDEEDIKDLINDVFLQFFNHAHQIHTSIKSYLTQTAKNASIQFLKKQENNCIPLEDTYLLQSAGKTYTYEILIRELAKIVGDEAVNIILLHSVDDLSFKSIGERLDMKENTVKTIYHRAILKYQKKVRRDVK